MPDIVPNVILAAGAVTDPSVDPPVGNFRGGTLARTAQGTYELTLSQQVDDSQMKATVQLRTNANGGIGATVRGANSGADDQIKIITILDEISTAQDEQFSFEIAQFDFR